MGDWINQLGPIVSHPIVGAVMIVTAIASGVWFVTSLVKAPKGIQIFSISAVIFLSVVLVAIVHRFPTSRAEPAGPAMSEAEQVRLFDEGERIAEANRFGAALDIFRRVEALNPDFPLIYINEAVMLKELGESEKALTLARKQESIRPRDPKVEYDIACLLAVNGNRDESLRELEAAIGDGFGSCQTLERDRDWNGLRSEERFERAKASVCQLK